MVDHHASEPTEHSNIAGVNRIAARQPRVASSVVVADDSGAAQSHKRSTETLLDERPDAKKRNKRLFGSLLGTLKKFQEDEQRHQKSDAAQRRAAAFSALERKAAEAQAPEEIGPAQAAGGEAKTRRELDAGARKKQIEAAYARRLERRRKEDRYLRTKTQPSLLWAPRLEDEAVAALRQQQKAATQEWEAALQSDMQKELAALDANGKSEHEGESGKECGEAKGTIGTVDEGTNVSERQEAGNVVDGTGNGTDTANDVGVAGKELAPDGGHIGGGDTDPKHLAASHA